MERQVSVFVILSYDLQFLALPGKTGEGEAAGGVMTVTDVTTLGLAVAVAVA